MIFCLRVYDCGLWLPISTTPARDDFSSFLATQCESEFVVTSSNITPLLKTCPHRLTRFKYLTNLFNIEKLCCVVFDMLSHNSLMKNVISGRSWNDHLAPCDQYLLVCVVCLVMHCKRLHGADMCESEVFREHVVDMSGIVLMHRSSLSQCYLLFKALIVSVEPWPMIFVMIGCTSAILVLTFCERTFEVLLPISLPVARWVTCAMHVLIQ